MPKADDRSMVTKHEEITHILQEAGEEDIEIIHLTDKMIIHIKTAANQPAKQRGKWAQVADRLADENLLGDGLGDELRAHARRFRETFVLK